MKGSVAILGARSTIATAIAQEFAAQGHDIHLVARDTAGLEADQKDIEIRSGATVNTHALDLANVNEFKNFLQSNEDISIVISVLGRQEEPDGDYGDASYRDKLIDGNYSTPVAIAEVSTAILESRGGGVFVGISSVAGDRGRQSNYLYGSAKAGYTAYLSGLRNRLAKSNTHVVTVKPGIIRTPLTSKQDFPPALIGKSSTVAKDIYKAVQKGRNSIYTPWFWLGVMLVIRSIPEFLFKKLSL